MSEKGALNSYLLGGEKMCEKRNGEEIKATPLSISLRILSTNLIFFLFILPRPRPATTVYSAGMNVFLISESNTHSPAAALNPRQHSL